jgi:NAD(P)-dependent dehydrogenase (short-subunit alcohol dehydrogenase family)
MSTKDKVIVITGAGSGIGKATALAFLEDGWRVALVGRRKESLEETAQAAGANRERALVVPADVGKPDSVQACFARVKQVFGRVDALFNNAGQNAPGVAFEDLPAENGNQWSMRTSLARFCARRRRFAS